MLYLFAIFYFIVYLGTMWINARLHSNLSHNFCMLNMAIKLYYYIIISRLSDASDSHLDISLLNERSIAECMSYTETLTGSWACALCPQTHFHHHVSSCSSQTPFSSSHGFYSWFCNGTCSVISPWFVLTLYTLSSMSYHLIQRKGKLLYSTVNVDLRQRSALSPLLFIAVEDW